MAKKKIEINYPSTDWIDRWIDRYIDNHPNEKIEDFKALEELAMGEWWDNEVDHDRPTPFDLTEEQEKASKKARITTDSKGEKKESKPRERKPNESKRFIINQVWESIKDLDSSGCVLNAEREITFDYNGKNYSLVLTEHRPKKN